MPALIKSGELVSAHRPMEYRPMSRQSRAYLLIGDPRTGKVRLCLDKSGEPSPCIECTAVAEGLAVSVSN